MTRNLALSRALRGLLAVAAPLLTARIATAGQARAAPGDPASPTTNPAFAGYQVSGDTFDMVGATFTVPSVACSSSAYNDQGIDLGVQLGPEGDIPFYPVSSFVMLKCDQATGDALTTWHLHNPITEPEYRPNIAFHTSPGDSITTTQGTAQHNTPAPGETAIYRGDSSNDHATTGAHPAGRRDAAISWYAALPRAIPAAAEEEAPAE